MKPVVGFAIRTLDDAFVIELEGACPSEPLAAIDGEKTQLVLPPTPGTELARALREPGELALAALKRLN